MGTHAYCLKLPPSLNCLHPVFPVVKLTPAPQEPFPGQRTAPPPPPELVDGEEEYVVERILDSHFYRGKLQFLVKWKGYGYEENMWVPEGDFHAPELVTEFYRHHSGAPRCISMQDFST